MLNLNNTFKDITAQHPKNILTCLLKDNYKLLLQRELTGSSCNYGSDEVANFNKLFIEKKTYKLYM